jgi:hypothetical protein
MQSSPRVRCFAVFAMLAYGACAVAQTAGSLSPFTTDGCSMFPDRSPLSKADWCDCCVLHDFAYWRGGTWDERHAADRDLRACVLRVSGDAALADLMYAGVRAGGGPYFYTSYRWGYGWPFGRGYAALSLAEQETASSLQAQYLATHPPRSCTR